MLSHVAPATVFSATRELLSKQPELVPYISDALYQPKDESCRCPTNCYDTKRSQRTYAGSKGRHSGHQLAAQTAAGRVASVGLLSVRPNNDRTHLPIGASQTTIRENERRTL